jgi:hypothetical protein
MSHNTRRRRNNISALAAPGRAPARAPGRQLALPGAEPPALPQAAFSPAQLQAIVDAQTATFQAQAATEVAKVDNLRRESEARIALERELALTRNAAEIENLRRTVEPNQSNQWEADGEDPSEATALFTHFPGIAPEYITAIFRGRFKPEQLCKLRLLHAYDDDSRTQEVTIYEGALQFKDKKLVKEFGDSPTIWQQGFLNYTTIVVSFWGSHDPLLLLRMNAFQLKVIELSTVYSWKQAVLPMALEWHLALVRSARIQVAHDWVLDRQHIDLYCTQTRLRTAIPPVAQPISRKRPRESDKPSICLNFNREQGCSRDNCYRDHTCQKCGANDHGMPSCKVKTPK